MLDCVRRLRCRSHPLGLLSKGQHRSHRVARCSFAAKSLPLAANITTHASMSIDGQDLQHLGGGCAAGRAVRAVVQRVRQAESYMMVFVSSEPKHGSNR
jgi:hypothetical protein